MAKKKILAIVGSLRKESWNRQLAEAVGQYLGDKADFEILEYADIPFMNEDLEADPPAAIQRVRAKVQEADGLWFFTPEYNHSYSGVLKNLIDWLSRPLNDGSRPVIIGKPAAISGASMGGGATFVAQDLLVMLLSFLNLQIMNQPRLGIGNVQDQAENGKLKLVSSQPYLEKQADAYLKFLDQAAQ